ncbi:MAG: hypothetical protein HGA98_02285 [Deltaproteobacteria bacterium]|nr:hypothetical protein [Deltaproteobacteria bacterium]
MNVDPWLVLGFGAQGLFSGRFLIQWIASERRKKSVIPVAFWWLSIAGSSLLLVYALHKRDPVFVLGQAGGLAVYVRNLMLLKGKKVEA